MPKGRVEVPDLSTRVCGRCCTDENNPELKPLCEGGNKHRFVRRDLWVGAMLIDTFDVRSEKIVLELMRDYYPSDCYVTARKVTSEEIAQLRAGAHLELAVKL